MKRPVLKFSIIALAILSFAFIPAMKESGTYQVDTDKSSLEWTGKKVTGQHFGKVDIKKGTLKIEDGVIQSGKVVVDMTTITVEDLEGKDKKKLEGHLRSEDFFLVEEHPTSTFEVGSVVKMAEETKRGFTHTVTGDLTIKGVTNEIDFPARIAFKEGKLAAYADLDIDRSRWKIKYGSSSFFKGLGDNMIYDNINFKVSLLAKKE